MTSPAISVGFISLGCAKNLVDSQIMAGSLLAKGIELAPSPENADVVIVNTCAFIEEAREESLAQIQAACDIKKSGRCRAVLVAGCFPQRYKHDVQDRLPDVDGFIGLDELEDVSHVVRRLLEGEHTLLQVSDSSKALFDPQTAGPVFSAGRYAYLKIAEGCDHPCAFCAIPGIRGRHRSRPIQSLVAEAGELVSRGFRELDLVSQDTTSYGKDLSNGGDLCALLRALGSVAGPAWIRLLYGYPTGISDELLHTMAETPQVCHYLDIPIQHSHPDILRAMLRTGTVEAVATMAKRARNIMPDITLRTTCLVGFPGETQDHFEQLLDYVTLTQFDHLGVFVFSPEEGTRAAALPDRPAPEVAEERRARLLQTQEAVVAIRAQELIGQKDTVLLEHREEAEGESIWVARSTRRAPEVDGADYILAVPEDAQPGDFARVEYSEQADYDMVAEACQA